MRFVEILAGLAVMISLSGCGVKGDPLPPEKAAEMGRGRPTYRRATERVRVIPQKPNSETEGESQKNQERLSE